MQRFSIYSRGRHGLGLKIGDRKPRGSGNPSVYCLLCGGPGQLLLRECLHSYCTQSRGRNWVSLKQIQLALVELAIAMLLHPRHLFKISQHLGFRAVQNKDAFRQAHIHTCIYMSIHIHMHVIHAQVPIYILYILLQCVHKVCFLDSNKDRRDFFLPLCFILKVTTNFATFKANNQNLNLHFIHQFYEVSTGSVCSKRFQEKHFPSVRPVRLSGEWGKKCFSPSLAP